jgi:hypothetical protein
MLNRREILIGTIAVAATANLPPVVVAGKPAEVLPAWVVGSNGEFDWQHIIARTEWEAKRFFAQDCGDYEDECDHDGHHEGCDCCDSIASYEAERKPMWDGTPYDKITPGDWMRSGTGHVCSRCSYETFPEEGGYGVGNEAVCSECMTLADWDIIDPEHAAELRADSL